MRPNCFHFTLLLLFALGMGINSAHGATISFSDGDFSSWVTEPILVGQTGEREATGGNPDAFWEVTTNVNSVTSTFFTDPSFVYDPASGAIDSVVFSLELKNLAIFGQGQGVSFGAKQGNSYYQVGSQVTVGSSGWTALTSSGVTFNEGDFGVTTGSPAGTLDFSGDPITFGFLTRNSGGATIRVGYDNYNATLSVSTVVPEPSSIVLLLGTVVLASKWRRLSRVKSSTL